jgi:hypothetical protein
LRADAFVGAVEGMQRRSREGGPGIAGQRHAGDVPGDGGACRVGDAANLSCRRRLYRNVVAAAVGYSRIHRKLRSVCRNLRRVSAVVQQLQAARRESADRAPDAVSACRARDGHSGHVGGGHGAGRIRRAARLADRLRLHGDEIGTAERYGARHREACRSGTHRERVGAIGQHQAAGSAETRDAAAQRVCRVRAGHHDIRDIGRRHGAGTVEDGADLPRRSARHRHIVGLPVGHRLRQRERRCPGTHREHVRAVGQDEARLVAEARARSAEAEGLVGASDLHRRHGARRHRSRAIRDRAREPDGLSLHCDRVAASPSDLGRQREPRRTGRHGQRIAAVGQHETRRAQSRNAAAQRIRLRRAGHHHVRHIGRSDDTRSPSDAARLTRRLRDHRDIVCRA